MTFPSVHLNGTSRQELESQLDAAVHAIHIAIDAVIGMAPNGRDYYVQGPTAFTAALDEHQSRLDRLRSVCSELGAIYLHLLDL